MTNQCVKTHSVYGKMLYISILLFIQLVFGFVSFLFPTLPDGPRATYLSVHVFFGIFIFALAIGTVLLGINEKLFFTK